MTKTQAIVQMKSILLQYFIQLIEMLTHYY